MLLVLYLFRDDCGDAERFFNRWLAGLDYRMCITSLMLLVLYLSRDDRGDAERFFNRWLPG